MTENSTAQIHASSNETFRSDDVSLSKSNLKINIATENTDIHKTKDKKSITSVSSEINQYWITKKFRIENPNTSNKTPNIFDDIRQRFSGVVTDIDFASNEFTAQISDLINPSNPDEVVKLGFDDILDSDKKHLEKGDSFIWYIGYVQGRMISRESFSKIRFRRFPTWTHDEIDAASSHAKELINFFQHDSDTTAEF